MEITNESLWLSNNQSLISLVQSKPVDELMAIVGNINYLREYEVEFDRNVAYLKIDGMLVPRTDSNNSKYWFFTPTYGILEAIKEIESRWEIDTLILHFDCGGGQATGVPELAEYIRNSRLYIIGFTDTISASGSYWLMSACDKVVASPSANVGSIGVYIQLYKYKEANWIQVYTFKAGEQKVFGNPHVEMTDGEEAYFDNRVKTLYEEFVESVANYRGLSTDVIRETEAGVFRAKETLGILVDEIKTLEQLLEE